MASRRKHESGQVVVLTAGAIVFLIGFAALATDVGFLYATRRNMQTVADAAAIAGSNALQAGQTFTQAQSAAQDVATLNGYSNGVNDVTVTVGHPASNPNPTTGTYVEVDVTRPVPTYFMRVLGFNTVNVGATAVSGGISGPACIYALTRPPRELSPSQGRPL